MVTRIEASWDVLLEQASDTADHHLRCAISATKGLPPGIDRTAVIVAHMRAASEDFRTAAISVAAQKLADVFEGQAHE